MKHDSKLPEHISPTNYNIVFTPDLEKFQFTGSQTITLNILKPTKTITLNSANLKVQNPILKTHNKSIIPKIKLNEKEQTLTLDLNTQIKGKATLSLDFKGILNDNLIGFYRSKYFDSIAKKEKYLATTQFEAPYARYAFPCFDQPDKKATFDITLEIPKNLQAISNMPISAQSLLPSKNNKLVKFQTTPTMSTYLLYLGVGEFEFLESNLGKTQIRVATTPGKSSQGKFALEIAKKSLQYFQDYSKVPYPLPKLDLIAIPDFNAGAMENWGAVTFREVLLLHNKNTSTRVKKRIAEVIAHELWHQWSGNLVTMKWWDDLWLNESFATYMAYKAINHHFPEWNYWEDFINNETQGALSSDSLQTTHPIAVKVSSPNQIEEIFDAISYGKGGSILRMLDNYLSPEVFQKGVSLYLKKHKYGNAIAENLWNSLSQVSDAPIKKIMKSWIQQPGFPLIEAQSKGDKLTLTQKKFSHSTKNNPKNSKTLWKIPLIIHTNSKTIKILFDKPQITIILPKNTSWFTLNNNQEGFYRVKYPDENLQKLSSLITQNKLSSFDRWAIQNDLFSLSIHNYLTLEKYLNFLSSYNNEQNYFVLSDIYINIYKIYRIFSQDPAFPQIWPHLKAHTKTPFLKNFEKLSWNPKEKENMGSSLLRSLVINYLGFIEDPKTVKTGMLKLQDYNKRPESLHPDLRGAIYALAAQNGDEKVYNQLISLYNKTQSPEEKVKVLMSLYKFKSPKILQNALDFALSNKVRSQDLRTVFGSAAGNPYLRPTFLHWTKKNWTSLESYKKSSFIFMGLLESLITSYTGKEKILEIKSFLDSKNTGFQKTKANAFEKAEINTNFLNNNKQILHDYFTQKA